MYSKNQIYPSALREKRVPKRCPWGTIASNGTLFSKGHSFFLNNHVYEKKEYPFGTGALFIKQKRKTRSHAWSWSISLTQR